ncbi:hypothetical protein [Vibrio cholerae]|uniref:hypothetical protein n=1 Tax=Vibrio cholerae TaxID=666 RepID=UPI0011D3168D|nr:hypothetical protein [Vibrio cholerae]TYA61608.1 hypothetical protein FXE55_00905 [Vibrio cholerae]GHW54533.1 hypothetical protein VCSRO57_2347 [Vibrio cholerae]
MKIAPEPKYKKLYSELLREHKALKIQFDLLKDKTLRLSDMVLSGNVGSVVVSEGDFILEVPKYIAEWMIEFDLPWQVFKCDTHGDWITELDSSFPYHMEMCKCPRCF